MDLMRLRPERLFSLQVPLRRVPVIVQNLRLGLIQHAARFQLGEPIRPLKILEHRPPQTRIERHLSRELCPQRQVQCPGVTEAPVSGSVRVVHGVVEEHHRSLADHAVEQRVIARYDPRRAPEHKIVLAVHGEMLFEKIRCRDDVVVEKEQQVTPCFINDGVACRGRAGMLKFDHTDRRV